MVLSATKSIFWLCLSLAVLMPARLVAANILPPRNLLARDGVIQNIQARNLSTWLDNIPTQCQVQCDVVVGAAHNCEYLSCVCTDTNAKDLVTCANCIVALNPGQPGIVSTNQAVLDEWTNVYCADYPTPPLYVTSPGSSSSSSSSSASASATSSGSDSLTTSVLRNGAPSSPRAIYIPSLVILAIGEVYFLSLHRCFTDRILAGLPVAVTPTLLYVDDVDDDDRVVELSAVVVENVAADVEFELADMEVPLDVPDASKTCVRKLYRVHAKQDLRLTESYYSCTPLNTGRKEVTLRGALLASRPDIPLDSGFSEVIVRNLKVMFENIVHAAVASRRLAQVAFDVWPQCSGTPG
ncbi:hypothetical protein K443DRAFT_93112 [Laccaria amethystina LaAM-08-1]|uniref:Unplaced genomic scaffold K443scaffold_34, whole genome shotgun sequence n=1 Tax=Laccaria amethystina LaAM-08-1 TaxID=1095629 RepID=A0A0C9Y944_9AGAR|nr:hypothetical protein K443DRAFT_93112 [Laccaria amethystina LaAM-08-1]